MRSTFPPPISSAPKRGVAASLLDKVRRCLATRLSVSVTTESIGLYSSTPKQWKNYDPQLLLEEKQLWNNKQGSKGKRQ